MVKRFGMTPAVIQFVTKSKKLREWTRYGLFENATAVAQKATNKTGRALQDGIRKEIDTTKKNQKMLDNFFEQSGFPKLPKNHPMAQGWDRRLAGLRKAVERADPEWTYHKSRKPKKQAAKKVESTHGS